MILIKGKWDLMIFIVSLFDNQLDRLCIIDDLFLFLLLGNYFIGLQILMSYDYNKTLNKLIHALSNFHCTFLL